MKLLTVLFACVLLLPNMAIAQVNRNGGNKVSNLGTFTANSDREASRKCSAKGGNIVVKLTNGLYSCHYAQQLAK